MFTMLSNLFSMHVIYDFNFREWSTPPPPPGYRQGDRLTRTNTPSRTGDRPDRTRGPCTPPGRPPCCCYYWRTPGEAAVSRGRRNIQCRFLKYILKFIIESNSTSCRSLPLTVRLEVAVPGLVVDDGGGGRVPG